MKYVLIGVITFIMFILILLAIQQTNKEPGRPVDRILTTVYIGFGGLAILMLLLHWINGPSKD